MMIQITSSVYEYEMVTKDANDAKGSSMAGYDEVMYYSSTIVRQRVS